MNAAAVPFGKGCEARRAGGLAGHSARGDCRFRRSRKPQSPRLFRVRAVSFPLRRPGLACSGVGRGSGAWLSWLSHEDTKTRRGRHLSSVLVTPDLIRGRAVLEEEPRTASTPPQRKRSSKVGSRRDRRGKGDAEGPKPPSPRGRGWGRGAEPQRARMPQNRRAAPQARPRAAPYGAKAKQRGRAAPGA